MQVFCFFFLFRLVGLLSELLRAFICPWFDSFNSPRSPSLSLSLLPFFICVQELAAAERVKRQAQQERDELQDEINNQASKK